MAVETTEVVAVDIMEDVAAEEDATVVVEATTAATTADAAAEATAVVAADTTTSDLAISEDAPTTSDLAFHIFPTPSLCLRTVPTPTVSRVSAATATTPAAV